MFDIGLASNAWIRGKSSGVERSYGESDEWERKWDRDMEVDITHGPIEKVTMEEVERAVKSMKLGKTAGESVVAAEYIIASGMVEIDDEGIPDALVPLGPLYKGEWDARDCGPTGV